MQRFEIQVVRSWMNAFRRLTKVLVAILKTALHYFVCRHRSNRRLAAENLFLRKQLALFQERGIKSRRTDEPTRAVLVWLSKAFNWRSALVIVQPATLIRWHKSGFRQYWKFKCRPGRPAIPSELRILIREMGSANPTWGEERIANELLLKLGLRISPRTVRKYMPKRLGGEPSRGAGDQNWSTFVRNHAEAIVACDFFTVATATFKVLYVFVVVEHATRRILHFNVTQHPTSDWVLQQLREAVPDEHGYEFLIRDRDAKFSNRLDESVRNLGLQTLKTPARTPQANGLCERTIGTIRRECLDYLIPMGEEHLRRLLSEWVGHYNSARPHSALGPGLPDHAGKDPIALQAHRHELPPGALAIARPVLGGLHHEYSLRMAA